ncbi:NADPH-dependent FMN reductase [Miniphocaeibacter halophilus]|uniref:NAD(P)H-dependent oxidoreductase n=1 Tax=Miniphocaeibacter halophilus TaxID=2931922 RepID=A0AC61MZP9_9FIRM|nr:NAD(P)H-dependent oxidoreductase [Miniphocaeibacter halophilus]QQK08940.1 NAD(P)H-dependent oxidoreductase [Miniphocaeibacter halophilus]
MFNVSKNENVKILLVVGSSRKGSYNQLIADYLRDKYGNIVDFRQADLKSLPVYSEDIENEDFPSVTKLREDVNWADGVLLLTPEHNFTMSVLMKNFIDWCSRVEHVLNGKPTMVTGATLGHLGTVMAQSHLRQALLSPGVKAIAVPNTEVYINAIQDRIKDGKLLEDKAESLNTAFINFIDYIKPGNGYCFSCN